MGQTQWGTSGSQAPQVDPVQLFWREFYTRMVPRSQIRSNTQGVDFYLGRDYKHLTNTQKNQIKEEADAIKNKKEGSKPYPYEGGRRKQKTRKHKASKKSKKTRKH